MAVAVGPDGTRHPFPQVDDDDGPFAVRGEIVGAVVDAARTRPVVLVLEDLHWADPASLRVLLLLPRR